MRLAARELDCGGVSERDTDIRVAGRARGAVDALRRVEEPRGVAAFPSTSPSPSPREKGGGRSIRALDCLARLARGADAAARRGLRVLGADGDLFGGMEMREQVLLH